MKKIITKKSFNIVLLCCLLIIFTGCKLHNTSIIEARIKLQLPEMIHVEYQGIVYIQQGNEVYTRGGSGNYSSNRNEVYAKINLNEPVILDEPQYAQGFITARWIYNTNSWMCADEESQDTTGDSPWHANDHNIQMNSGAEINLRTGYSDINTPYETDGVSIEQKEDKIVRLADGTEVNCCVWEYTWDRNNIYNKSKYYFAKDSNVFIKHQEIFNRNDDIDSTENTKKVATLYKTGSPMATELQNLNEPRIKMTFDEKYK